MLHSNHLRQHALCLVHLQQSAVLAWLQVAQLQEQVSARDATLRNIHAARDQQQQQLLLAMGKDKQELDAQARLLCGSRLLSGACPIHQLTVGRW